MTPEVIFGSSAALLCVAQKLAAIKMAIRTEADTQKQVAIESGIAEPKLARLVNGQDAFTFQKFDQLPEEVQRLALFEMLVQMGLPRRVNRWLSIARELESREKEIA